ncbi:SIMPL domain-containing protein [Echinimonas agarilytica]|uniref:SIMPL domain-containing protein n=1 Tax=Echinimonas agarilytica TaxID=1215918 RepID=A0AA42B6T7_9GAMM|nr:SIMPL domain-containing protein [Echinimonas agarilytica]MCM2678881.1 SIMPL domain-containing protein [Echinimonas agarilytica]
MKLSIVPAALLALGLIIGLWCVANALPEAVSKYRSYDRVVTVKGLAEKEVAADVVVWPIQFSAASNDLQQLYQDVQDNADKIRAFLILNGIDEGALTTAPPAITDKKAQSYGNNSGTEFRYSAMQTVTVYSTDVDIVRQSMSKLSDLGKQGITFLGNAYSTQYLYTQLNAIKPEMVEQSTKNAREVALKFAEDSQSSLGKIKLANQGQFSISARDHNSPHIKKVRVVSTVQYYLAD